MRLRRTGEIEVGAQVSFHHHVGPEITTDVQQLQEIDSPLGELWDRVLWLTREGEMNKKHSRGRNGWHPSWNKCRVSASQVYSVTGSKQNLAALILTWVKNKSQSSGFAKKASCDVTIATALAIAGAGCNAGPAATNNVAAEQLSGLLHACTKGKTTLDLLQVFQR